MAIKLPKSGAQSANGNASYPIWDPNFHGENDAPVCWCESKERQDFILAALTYRAVHTEMLNQTGRK